MKEILFALLCLAVHPAPRQEASDAQAQPVRKWQIVLDWVREQRDRMGADLEAAHGILYSRAQSEEPALAKRLSPEPPKPLVWGYGIVPTLRENSALKRIAATENVYSIERLSTMFPAAFRDAAMLARRAREEPAVPLKWAIEEYLRLKGRLANLDQRISYHEFWQKDIVRARGWYDGRNAIVGLARQRRVLAKSGQFADKVAELTAEIQDAVAPFVRQKGMVIEKDEDGVRVLRVNVASDVEGGAFLDAFRAAVDEAWSQSQAARDLRFRIELNLEAIAPAELYPEGPPARASPLDLDQHLARFPEGYKVLTTGAKSMHSGKGYVQLGPTSVMPRVLAHEFGHLLGFADAYLRGYEGDPDGPYGVRVVEWTGLMDDLMGGPAVGRVTRGMIEQLLEAYNPDR